MHTTTKDEYSWYTIDRSGGNVLIPKLVRLYQYNVGSRRLLLHGYGNWFKLLVMYKGLRLCKGISCQICDVCPLFPLYVSSPLILKMNCVPTVSIFSGRVQGIWVSNLLNLLCYC